MALPDHHHVFHPRNQARRLVLLFFFFFNDTATTEIYTLSLHDALPISTPARLPRPSAQGAGRAEMGRARDPGAARSEEHTSELQSRLHLVCRLLLEKKKKYLRPKSSQLILNAHPATYSTRHSHPSKVR